MSKIGLGNTYVAFSWFMHLKGPLNGFGYKSILVDNVHIFMLRVFPVVDGNF